jgi:HAD superfamily hydrolase (TIGR01509 family)
MTGPVPCRLPEEGRIDGMISAVVFDMDGVIVDSEGVWEQVRRAYVADRGGTWAADSQQRLMGMSTPEWAEYLATGLGVRATPDEVAEQVIELMAQEYRQHLPLIDGSVAAVRRIAGRWPVAVASSSPPSLIGTVLAAAGLADTFAGWVSSEQVPRGKPAPDVYLAAAELLGVAPTACAAVEDSSNGLRSAAAAGMRVVAIPQPQYPPAPDALALAAVVLDDIGALTAEAVAG